MQYNKPFDQTNPAAGYVNGNPATNTAGSIPCAEGLEYPQREIVNAITAAGLTPTNGDLTQLAQAIKALIASTAITPVVAAVTLYVDSSTGSDATGDGSQAKPFRTNARAIRYAASRYAFGGYGLLVQMLSAGAYDLPAVVTGVPNLTILGAPANRGNYLLTGAGTKDAQTQVTGTVCTISGATLRNTNPALNTIAAGSNVTIDNCDFTGDTALNASHLFAGPGGSVTLSGTIGIAQSAGAILDAQGGTITSFGTINVPSAGVFTNVVNCINGRVAFGTGAAWGGTTSGRRFYAGLNGVIQLYGRGVNFIPGTTAGTSDTGGQVA
ncbi:hypothetical protein ABID82_007287 [Methylobacterium sp. PvP062]|uniref:Uncharacterized protein n=1 Tax=Methylobacterium radiotolerans TaxID=31998 RepID=A0ABV2NPA8_9HYPH|nr:MULTISPECIES: hypothetical protein [unclassified Methylobacterium]MBP2494928.1 hypothetical protein [Methylobacterium sp. PvP105]MBP2505201.1 hypothetical protein [Methylobacterium sp. PvP109]